MRCAKKKKNMQELSQDELGSWTRAVVTSDGVWHTREHFSKSDSFIVKFVNQLCRNRVVYFFVVKYYGFPETEIYFFRKVIFSPFKRGVAFFAS